MFCLVLCSGSILSGIKILRLLSFIFLIALFSPGMAATVSGEVVRVGISPQAVFNANVNDVLATIKVWSQNAVKAHGLQAAFDVNIVESAARLRNELKEERLEIVVASIDEIESSDFVFDTVFISIAKGSFPVRYVLVVHRDSAISTPEELDNKVVAIPHGDFMQLAELWFDTCFQKNARTPASFSLTKKTDLENISKAAMQVFFRQIDAAVIRRDTLNSMEQLNPQIKKDLLVIRESEPLMPMVLVFRPSWQTALRDSMEKVLSELHTTPLGEQILMVFHCIRLEKHPITVLDSTLAFLQKSTESTKK